MKIRLNIVLFFFLALLVFAQFSAADIRRELNFPDIQGYKTLKCDFHMHTVFSDGLVWPTLRIDEAWRQGLDVVAITDHIEYQPHKKDIPTNHKRPFEIASTTAKRKNILLVKGAEITRDTPPGHFNALFVNDINALDTEDLLEAAKAAKKQGAFIFWNHPGWKPKKKGWFDIHTQLYQNKCLDGIEVVNGRTYDTDSYQWCLEKNLTIIGNSDSHRPIVDYRISREQNRTLTLVFAKEKTLASLKEALVKGRTAVWYDNSMIGKELYLNSIFNASIQIAKPHYQSRGSIWVEIKNNSPVDIEMERVGRRGPSKLTLAANTVTLLKTSGDEKAKQLKLSYRVKNFIIAPSKPLPVDLIIPLK